MSRSYKRSPVIKDDAGKKFGKKYANKRVRHSDIDSGGQYKKVYDSYNICDYSFNLYGIKKEDGIPVYRFANRKMSIVDILKYWRK